MYFRINGDQLEITRTDAKKVTKLAEAWGKHATGKLVEPNLTRKQIAKIMEFAKA